MGQDLSPRWVLVHLPQVIGQGEPVAPVQLLTRHCFGVPVVGFPAPSGTFAIALRTPADLSKSGVTTRLRFGYRVQLAPDAAATCADRASRSDGEDDHIPGLGAPLDTFAERDPPGRPEVAGRKTGLQAANKVWASIHSSSLPGSPCRRLVLRPIWGCWGMISR